jgi:hypothetical protein
MLNTLKTIANICAVASTAIVGLEFAPSWLVLAGFGLKAVADGIKSFYEAQNEIS